MVIIIRTTIQILVKESDNIILVKKINSQNKGRVFGFLQFRKIPYLPVFPWPVKNQPVSSQSAKLTPKYKIKDQIKFKGEHKKPEFQFLPEKSNL